MNLTWINENFNSNEIRLVGGFFSVKDVKCIKESQWL